MSENVRVSRAAAQQTIADPTEGCDPQGMTFPLLAADQTWALWAVLLCAGAFGLWAETTRWGRRLSGAVIAIGTTFVLSNLGVIPSDAPPYDAVWSYVVPLAIPLLLLRADVRRIVREAGPTLGAYLIGAAGTVLGTILAFQVVDLGPDGPKIAGIFCATYVGGSMNYVAAAEVLGLRSGDVLSAGIAADNLVMTLYFLVLFALPSLPGLRKRFAIRHVAEEPAQSDTPDQADGVPVGHLAASLAIAATACAIGHAIETVTWPKTGVLWMTLLVVLAATAFPSRLSKVRGATRVGTVLMQIFFATIGASANIGVVLRVGPVLFLFAALILLVHLAVILLFGKLLRLDLAEIVIASNANMGGPTTSAAMAVACRWQRLVLPAVLCGTLGYAIGTFVGVAVGRILGA